LIPVHPAFGVASAAVDVHAKVVGSGHTVPPELDEELELDEEEEPVEYTLLAQAPPQVSLLSPVQGMLQLFDVPCDP
jgi:hypothetical protein